MISEGIVYSLKIWRKPGYEGRIGSSSYYTFTGDQLFLAVIAECEDSVKRDQASFLGGQALVTAADFADEAKRTAYVYLKCPWNSISAQEKPLPLPSDLLTQPLQWVIKLRNFSEVFFRNTAVPDYAQDTVPSSLASAKMTFKQIHMMDKGMLLARRENMNEKAISYPLRYFQNTTFRTTVNVTAGQPVQLNLTGLNVGLVCV